VTATVQGDCWANPAQLAETKRTKATHARIEPPFSADPCQVMLRGEAHPFITKTRSSPSLREEPSPHRAGFPHRHRHDPPGRWQEDEFQIVGRNFHADRSRP
jgi:hypothetical protein